MIDADVHESISNLHELEPYLGEPWRSILLKGSVGKVTFPYSLPTRRKEVAGSVPRKGKPAGSDLGLFRRQLFDEYAVTTAILNGQISFPTELNVQSAFASALAASYNDWLIANWLSQDGRLRGSICINANDPQGAAREIDRVGVHQQMVQVCLFPTSRGLGEPFFQPILEAAQRRDLVVGIHAGLASTTPIGFAPYYIEWRTCFPQHIQSQLVSLISHGVFERFPNLRVSLIEGGWTWLPSLMWRFDLSYRSLRYEVPWLKRMPSDYIRTHIRLTTNPDEALTEPEFVHLLDVIGSEEVLMFASGYPHWDFDSPRETMPGLPAELARKVFRTNAENWYRLASE